MNTTQPPEVAFFQRSWKGFIVIPSTMLVLNLWVATAFGMFAIKTKAHKRRSRSDMNGGIIFKAALTSECLATCRYISTITMYFVGLDANGHTGCLAIVYVNNVFFVAPLIAMYVFLWARQRAFYQHPLIGGLFSQSISILSRISLVLIVTLILISLVLEMVLNRYESSPVGCRFVTTQTVSQFRFIGYALVWISGQALMMSLFVYPLSVHSKSLKTMDPENLQRRDKSHSVVSDNHLDVSRTNLDVTRHSYLAVTPVMKTKLPHEQNTENHLDLPTINTRHSYLEVTPVMKTKLPHGQNTQNHLDSSTTNLDASRNSYLSVTPVLKPKRHHKPNANSNTQSADEDQRKSRREKKVYNLIRRTLTMACVSIASDMTAMGVSGFLVLGHSPYYVMCLFLDANTTVNVITVLLSFHSWRDILLFRHQCCSCLPGTCKSSAKATSVDSSTSNGHTPRSRENPK